jgi:protein kinase C substrate 80K-H
MNFALFFSSYYEKIYPHINSQESSQKHENANTDQEQPQVVEHEHTEGDQHSNHEEELHEEDETESTSTNENEDTKPSTEQKFEKKYDEETQLLIDESDKARKQFEDSDSQFRGIEMEISDAKKKLELDVGPNNEFASMIDKCFEYEDREYIYKMCPFEKTVQKSKSNSGETSIGTWKGWNEDASKKYNLMHFDNGQSCWNGPQRSTKVHLSCGIENKVTSVSEPNRCEVNMLLFIYFSLSRL